MLETQLTGLSRYSKRLSHGNCTPQPASQFPRGAKKLQPQPASFQDLETGTNFASPQAVVAAPQPHRGVMTCDTNELGKGRHIHICCAYTHVMLCMLHDMKCVEHSARTACRRAADRDSGRAATSPAWFLNISRLVS